MKKFESEWASYRTLVIHKDAGDAQIRETKRAFYAGASSVITIIGSLFDIRKGPDPTEEDVKVLEDVWKELDEYFKNEAFAEQKVT